MAFHQTISGELLASPDFRDGGSRTVRRAVSNLEAMYTPMARTLRQTESDLGQSTARSMSSPSSSPMFGLNNRGSNIQGASSLFDDLNGLERAAIQGLGLQTDFENCRRPVFNSHSAPGNDLRASFVAQDNNNMRRMPLTRRATDIGPNHADIYEGADVDGGVSLHEEEEDACDGVPEDDMNIALDFKKLCFSKDKHGLNTFQEPHHNTIGGPFTLVAAPPPFIWNPSCENRQFHQNFSNVNNELSQKGPKELPQNDLNVAKVFAGHGHGLGVSQLNPLGHSTGHGFGISSLSNSLNQARNYRGHHSVGSGSGRCPYANTPGAFGSPSAEVYGVFPKYHTALPRENAINRPQLLSTTQIQPPEEKTTSGINDRTKRAPECGLEAFELAVEENWHVMMHPINQIITKFNENTRFYVIKSTGELDIYSSMKWGIWTSTDLGNKRLDKGFRSHYGLGPVLLFFSVNSSGKFCGVAEMTSAVDFKAKAGVWSERRWRGHFDVKWLYVKDIPMSHLRHIQVSNNEGRNISISRDTQELLPNAGFAMLHMFIHFPATTGMLWDSSKGMIPCAPPGRPFEREVFPRIYGAPPAPRPLPNFIGEPEGYSRKSFAASSVGSTASHPSYIRRASSHSSNAAPLGGPGPLIPNGAPLGGPGPLIRFDSGDTRPHSSHVASVIRAGNSYVGFNNPESKDHVSVCNGASRDGNNVDLNLVTPSFNGNLVGGFSSYTRFNSPLASLDAHAREFGPQQSGYEAGGCTHVPLDSTVSSEAALEKQSDGLCQQNRFYNFRFPVEQ